MANTGPVHWYEGLFLQPHHLQAMQRHAHEGAVAERRTMSPYPYGVVESRLSSDALSNMLVQFDRLRVVMPSGTVVDFPDSADLPPLDIKSAFQSTTASFTVSIGLPIWYSSRGNTLDAGNGGAAAASSGRSSQTKRLYSVADVQRVDENTGENSQPLLLRRLNARLLLSGDDTTDLEVLPVVRIAHSTGQDAGLPRQDPTFITPLLIVRGSNVLYEQLRDLANIVEARREQLLARMKKEKLDVENMRGSQFAQLMKLRTLNHFSPRLSHFVRSPSLYPFDIYLELRALLGELAALKPDPDLTLVADYDHDSPSVPFAELIGRIKQLLPREGEVTIYTVPFVKGDRQLVASLSEQHLKKPNGYFLGIKTRQDLKSLTTLVEDADKFKAMARSLARADIWGIKLAYMPEPPLQLPKPAGMHYYRMELNETPSSQRMWERIQQERAMTLVWREIETADYEAALYMTVPESEEQR